MILNNIEKYLLFAIIVIMVIFIIYFVFVTIKKATKSAPKVSLLYSLNDYDPKVFNQILIDMRDDKLEYIFENYNIEKKSVEDVPEYGLCLILKIDTGNDLWEVSIYEDIVEVFNLTNSTNHTMEFVYAKDDVNLSKEQVYSMIMEKIK